MSYELEIGVLVDEFGRTSRLSPKQCHMLRLSVAGICRKEIAAQLSCSVKTVEGYWKRIYQKTACRSEPEVIAKFIRVAVELQLRERAHGSH